MPSNDGKRSCLIRLLILFIILTLIFFATTIGLAVQNASYSKEVWRNLTQSDNIKNESSVKNYRLPTHVIPKNYRLILHPSTNKTFEGKVTIIIEVLKPTKRITLNSNLLDIYKTRLMKKHESIAIFSTEFSADTTEFLHVNLQNEIPKGVYELKFEYGGKLSGLVGFYESTLNSGHKMVASKFEPTYARQAFPCFDEPEYKATYDTTLMKPTSYVALSNMNAVSSKLSEDGKIESVTFATSVPMSTYLACFVICDFDFIEDEVNSHGIGNDFKLRSFAQKNEMHKIDFAQDIGKRATEFYIKYYEVPFPLPKLDMIAIPDYQSGATEHWGLITYRETSFLVDKATASATNKLSVANTICHELAHMWFGNLVTMKWWDDIWLNEGFATYMQCKVLDAIEPTWETLHQFLLKNLHPVLKIDAKLSSHPIVMDVKTPDEITAIFDSISYKKGASIIRMLEGFMGLEHFRNGISDYLKKYQFSNTETRDLLSSLELHFKKGDQDLHLGYIMDTWTRQMGYPLLTLTQGDEPNTFVVTQSRFLLDPEAVYKNDSPFNYRWYVPITYKTNKGDKNDVIWLADTARSVNITLSKGEHWLKVNNDQIGYYRVNYTQDMWKKLIKLLKENPDQLSISDRAHLLNDAFALAEASVLRYEIALELFTYLSVETAYVPLVTAYDVFLELGDKLRGTPGYDDLMKFIQQLIKPFYEKQSWETANLTIMEGLVRTRVFFFAARCQLPQAIAEMRKKFTSWLQAHGTEHHINIEPELRDVIYSYSMKEATQEEWDKLWNIYMKEEDIQEKTKLRVALAAPHNLEILKKYLALAWDENNVRGQDYLNLLYYLSVNPNGTELIWDFIKENWPKLVQRFTLNSRYLGNLIPDATGYFHTEEKLKEMEDFFAKYPEAGAGEAARKQALEAVNNNIKWARSFQSDVSAWLKAHVQH